MHEVDRSQEALRLLRKVEPYMSSMGDDSLLYTYHFLSGSSLFQLDQLQKAADHALRAVAIANQLKGSHKKLEANASLANIYTKMGLYSDALHSQRQAMKYVDEGDSTSYYSLLNNIALSYESIGVYDSALYALMRSKEYFSRIGDIQKLAILEANIGDIYRGIIGEFDLAQKHYLKAIALNKSTNSTQALSRDYYNYGLLFENHQMPDSAAHYYNKSLKNREKYGDHSGMAQIYYALGKIEVGQENYQEGIEYFAKAIKISEKEGIVPGIYHVTMALGHTYTLLNEYKRAFDNYQKALALAEMMEWDENRRDTYFELYSLHRKFQRWEDALLVLEQYNALTDTLENRKSANDLARLRTQYETQLAKAENEALLSEANAASEQVKLQRYLLFALLIGFLALCVAGVGLVRALRQRNKALLQKTELNDQLNNQLNLLKVQEAKLKEANEFKNKVISVIGHDLRTPLNGILGILELSRGNMVEAGIPLELFDRLQLEANMNLKTLQNLILWSRAEVQSLEPDRTNIDCAQIIAEIKGLYEVALKGKNLELRVNNADQLHVDMNQFRSILANLLSNAIKYSNNGGVITISCTQLPQGYELVVEDEGIGVKPEALEQLHSGKSVQSSRGTSGEKGTGLGLVLVSDFAKAHGGALVLEAKAQGGTKAVVTFAKVSEMVESE